MNKSGNIEAIYSLSPLQEGILFHALYTPQSMGYFEQSSSTLEGELNAAAFEQAWQTIVDRHPILRTLFTWEKRNQPLQIVRQKVRSPFTYQDWRSYSPSEQQAQLEAFLTSDRKQGFNLSKAPLMRLAVMRLDERRYQFTWSFHHLLLDGWSGRIVLSEFFTLYEAYCRDERPTLPHRRPYRDYIRWLQEQDLTRSEPFWRNYMDGFTKPTPFGVDKPKSEGETEAYANQEFVLPEVATKSLQRLAQQHHLTMSTIIQSVWAIILSRYSNELDVVFGTTVSGRTAPLKDIENMVGLFINTLPLRVEVPPDVSLLEWLQALQIQQTERRLYEHSPLTHIQQCSGLSARVPLFESILVMVNYPIPQQTETEQHSLKKSDVRVFEQTNFPLTVVVVPGSNLLWRLQYDCHRFDDETITRMLGHIQTILEYLVTKPKQRLSELSILTEAEQHKMLVEWNNTQTSYPRHSTVHQLFEAQVERRPDDIAVVFGNQQLNYRELNNRANKLANHLRKWGVGPDICVGLYLERSMEMVVAILGILKAGGAYVPLDPQYQSERLAFILSDIEAQILLTQQSLMGQLLDEVNHIICLDTDWATIEQESGTGLTTDSNSRNLAYIIYTSGSTGQPKGVMIEHGSLVNYLIWAKKQYMHDGPHDFPLFTTISADLTITSIFLPLISGSRIVVYRETKDAVDLSVLNVFNDDRVDIIKLTPSHLSMIVDQNIPSKRVKKLIVGGEDFKTGLAQRAVDLFNGNIEIFNEYGPTEATVGCMIHRFDSDSDRNSSVAIGKPIDNLQIYLLDAGLNPAPIGVKSDIYIAGKGLARGYLNQPELTSKMFIANPFRPGEMMYCSGDVGRWKAKGILQFLGRIDHQVKIRGFRIELGEIETVLSQHPDVQEAVVVVREDPQGEKQVVGYVVPAQEAVSPSELRQHLKQTLPEYMVPAIFLKLDALPLTPNGKVDRRALPVPEGGQPQVETDFVAPRSPYEDAVAEIWRDSMGLKQVGIYDNFFDLGGHSLLVIKIVSRLKTTFGVDIPLRAFFDSPTIAGVSAILATACRGGKPTKKVGILPVARNGNLPLSFAQERFWVLDQFHTNRAVFNGSRGFRLRGPFQLEVFRNSVQALVDRHEILRTTFASVGGELHQVIAPTLSVEVPLQNCSALSKQKQAGMIQQAFLEEGRFQFDLAHSPLFRTRLLRFAEDDHFLVLNFHHIILDAWSWEVIFKDLVRAYAAGCTGYAVTLPALPIQYVDYVHWQRELLEGPIGREQLAFWKAQLAQLPPALPLPTDYARPAVQTFRGAHESLRLSTELLAPLRALNRQEGTTLFMVLLATLQFLLHRLTGTHDILVGSPIAGRDQQELHGLIGCFLNTLVLRTDLSDDLTGRDLLQRVREVVLNAYENQDVPFEKILAEVDPARDLSRTPIFQVLLNMHSFDDQNLPLPELSVTRVLPTDINSLFDMTLYFSEFTDEIQLSLVYNADLFKAERMTEFMRQFQSILEQMINDPDRPLEAFTLVTPSARLYLPDPQQPFDAVWEGPVWSRLEHHAHQQGESIAMVSPGETWTYQDLEARSNQLAHYLLEQGVKAQEVVAIYASRSPELVLALFGILKAGTAFLILDPAYPSARLLEMLKITRPCGFIHLEDAGSLPDEVDVWADRVLFRVRLPAFAAAETDFEELLGSNLKAAPEVKVQPDDVAYVTFTSGSTGTPKCLQGTHRPLSHFLSWYTKELQLTAADRVTMFSGLAHDPLLRDVFTPLWIGGTLCIPDSEALALGRVRDWMNEQKITLMHLTPPLVDVLTVGRETSRVSCISLRYAVFGGESLRPGHLDCIKQLAPQATCVNGYGATETPQIMGWYVVPPEFPSNREQVSIGQGIDDVQILVLNNKGQLAGVGELGEIYIRTPYLTLGYVNDEALTSARFLPNPFRPEAGDRMYRTGDMGRLLPDGNIEFAGRKDFQVKIRGFRIEVGEIEVVLGQHPAVTEVVVVPGEDTHSDRHLVAYLVINENPSSSISEIRSFLKQKLPEHMIPSAFVFLNALPRTPNGKVDHRVLPEPDLERSRLETKFVTPRTPVEKALAKIWSDVLDLERVGIHDNFFELGGHSLLATQIISQIRKVFQLELPLRSLFEAPTLAELSSVMLSRSNTHEQIQKRAQLLLKISLLSEEEVETMLIKKELTAKDR